MLITFKSKAAADVLMYEEHAKPMLELLQKESQRGIITAAETGNAIRVLEEEIARIKAVDNAGDTEQSPREDDAFGDVQGERSRSVSFSTRAYPLLEMLRAAHQADREVVWGV